jgi:hypothetical protein
MCEPYWVYMIFFAKAALQVKVLSEYINRVLNSLSTINHI